MLQNSQQTTPVTGAKQKNIASCDFRSAARISNEDARVLTALHESFARTLAAALDGFVEKGLAVKLGALDQLRFEEHIAEMPPLFCTVPFSMRSTQVNMIMECDIDLALPLVDLLLGGTGSPFGNLRDLSEIEEEIMLHVFLLIVRQAEASWHMPHGSLHAGKRVRPAMLDQYCAPNEKVTCLTFVVQMGETEGTLRLVLPSAFLDILLQHARLNKPQKKASVRYFPKQSIRDRMLDCDVEVAVELSSLKIAVKDLLALLPGSVLKLRASVQTPGLLTAGGHGIFEATPVRNGPRKAAQLGRRVASANLEGV